VKAVLDTNVLLSAFTKPGGRVVALWEAALEQRYQLLLSPAIITEVARKLRSKFGWEESRIIQRSKLLAKTGKRIIVPPYGD
jgi:predicted nucleic acid-binding protein